MHTTHTHTHTHTIQRLAKSHSIDIKGTLLARKHTITHMHMHACMHAYTQYNARTHTHTHTTQRPANSHPSNMNIQMDTHTSSSDSGGSIAMQNIPSAIFGTPGHSNAVTQSIPSGIFGTLLEPFLPGRESLMAPDPQSVSAASGGRGSIMAPNPESISVSSRPPALPFDLFVPTAQPFHILSAAHDPIPTLTTPERAHQTALPTVLPGMDFPLSNSSPVVPKNLPPIDLSLLPTQTGPPVTSLLRAPKSGEPRINTPHMKKTTEAHLKHSILDKPPGLFLCAEDEVSAKTPAPKHTGNRTLSSWDPPSPPRFSDLNKAAAAPPEGSSKGPISSLSGPGSHGNLMDGIFRSPHGDSTEITCPFQALQKALEMRQASKAVDVRETWESSSPIQSAHPLTAVNDDTESIHSLVRQNSDGVTAPSLSRPGSNYGQPRHRRPSIMSVRSAQTSRSGSGTLASGMTSGPTVRDTSTTGGSGTRRGAGGKKKFGGGVFRGKTNKKKMVALSKSNTPHFDEALCRQHAPLVKESWMLAMTKRTFSELGLLYYDTLFGECPVSYICLYISAWTWV
jgi:hypothetical protein